MSACFSQLQFTQHCKTSDPSLGQHTPAPCSQCHQLETRISSNMTTAAIGRQQVTQYCKTSDPGSWSKSPQLATLANMSTGSIKQQQVLQCCKVQPSTTVAGDTITHLQALGTFLQNLQRATRTQCSKMVAIKSIQGKHQLLGTFLQNLPLTTLANEMSG